MVQQSPQIASVRSRIGNLTVGDFVTASGPNASLQEGGIIVPQRGLVEVIGGDRLTIRDNSRNYAVGSFNTGPRAIINSPFLSLFCLLNLWRNSFLSSSRAQTTFMMRDCALVTKSGCFLVQWPGDMALFKIFMEHKYSLSGTSLKAMR